VAALAQATHEGEVHTFTVSFPETPDADEAAVASRVASRLGTVHTQCVIDESTALEWVRGALAAMDQPSADGVNTYLVSRAAHEAGIVVALSGQGGDELFGGYDSFTWVDRWTPRLGALGRLVPAKGRAGLAWIASARRTNIHRAKTVDLAAAHPDVISLYLAYKRELSTSHLRHLDVDLSPLRDLGSDLSSDLGTALDKDRLAAVRLLEIEHYLTNTLLRDGDVFGMANAVEIRVPFLDQGLVEFICSLPGPAFLPPGQRGKWLLRQSCADLYDPEQLALPKKGFVLPLGLWMLGPLAEVVQHSLETLCASGLVDPAGVRLVHQHFLQAPESLAWTRLWTLVALGNWLAGMRQLSRDASAGLLA
jgi:asparagine synthase (glutamine-hydrolysing)